MFAQCPCGRKIAVNRDSVDQIVECPNCRQSRTLILAARLPENRSVAAQFLWLEKLGACVMWIVAVAAIAAVLFAPH
jgi:hypothetical protein